MQGVDALILCFGEALMGSLCGSPMFIAALFVLLCCLLSPIYRLLVRVVSCSEKLTARLCLAVAIDAVVVLWPLYLPSRIYTNVELESLVFFFTPLVAIMSILRSGFGSLWRHFHQA